MTGCQRTAWYALGVILVVATIGCRNPQRQKSDYYTEMAKHTVYDPYSPSPSASSEPANSEWTCPMHPQIQENQPGKCSICGMDLTREGESSPNMGNSSSHSTPSSGSHSKKSGCCG